MSLDILCENLNRATAHRLPDHKWIAVNSYNLDCTVKGENVGLVNFGGESKELSATQRRKIDDALIVSGIARATVDPESNAPNSLHVGPTSYYVTIMNPQPNAITAANLNKFADLIESSFSSNQHLFPQHRRSTGVPLSKEEFARRVTQETPHVQTAPNEAHTSTRTQSTGVPLSRAEFAKKVAQETPNVPSKGPSPAHTQKFHTPRTR